MRLLRIGGLLLLAAGALNVYAQTGVSLAYRVEASANASSGEYAPMWLTANRYGLSSVRANSGYLRAGLFYAQLLKRGWRVEAGLDLAGTLNHGADAGRAGFVVQQAYGDLSWRMLTLSIGSKERPGFPLEKDGRLSSGMLVEGPNARPVPQVRGEIREYLPLGFTGNWLSFKGHIAYGRFTDNGWQEAFVAPGQYYARDVYYHSKSLMFRLGNREKFPLTFEFGLLMATQFAGDRLVMQSDGTGKLVTDMPDGLKAFWKAFMPQAGGSDTPAGEQVNVEGNMLGSWNFALTYGLGDWRLRAYLEHYFEDHSQMFWEYGRWKDGQLGLEVTLPKNRWVSKVLWEGLATNDQTGSILYDGFWGSFPDVQVSGNDGYYNHYIYQAWQHAGMAMGNPLLTSPAYNEDGSITFKSNRVRSNHVGLTGDPTEEWNWRVLASFTRHWGTYSAPLDKQRKQFSSLWEVTYQPRRIEGWCFSVALGLDRGNYTPGNTAGGMITIRKTGLLLK